MNHLLHPELFQPMPLFGERTAARLNHHAQAATEAAVGPEPAVSVVIRTLNEAPQLHSLLGDIQAQKFGGEVELIVVDNESSDQTLAVAKAAQAEVVNIKRGEFTHPRSLNAGLRAASHDVVFVASGHVSLTTDQLLRAGSRHLRAGAAGAYAWPPLTNANASMVERIGIDIASHALHKPRTERRPRWGILSMAGSVISRSAWKSVGGFDESYETGAEDRQLAAKLLSEGEKIIFDPVMAIHHTHGLNTWHRLARTHDLAKVHVMSQGGTFDRDRMARLRPDLQLFD